MNSVWALSASVVCVLLIWTILSRKFLKYVLDWSGLVANRSGEVEEEFHSTAYLRQYISSSLVNIDEMKLMQCFLKNLTDLLVTGSFYSTSFISLLEPKPTSGFFFKLFFFKKLKFITL